MLGHPAVALMLYIGIVWVLHTPRLYQATVGSNAIHYLQHGLFMLGAGLFWLRVFAWGRGSALKQGMAILYLVAAMIPGMLLGAIIGFAARPIYPVYAQSAAAWGVDALVDQQTGGFMMLMPAALIYFGVAAALALKILSRPESEPQLPSDSRFAIQIYSAEDSRNTRGKAESRWRNGMKQI
jgi:putative membrane protein